MSPLDCLPTYVLISFQKLVHFYKCRLDDLLTLNAIVLNQLAGTAGVRLTSGRISCCMSKSHRAQIVCRPLRTRTSLQMHVRKRTIPRY